MTHRNNHCISIGRKIAYDHDTLKEALENSSIKDIFVACDISVSAAIAYTSNSNVIGVGSVKPQITWIGAAGTAAFDNAAATDVTFSNIYFAFLANWYRVRLRTRCKLLRCKADLNVLPQFYEQSSAKDCVFFEAEINGDDVNLNNVEVQDDLFIYDAQHLKVFGGSIVRVRARHYDSYDEDKDWVFDGVDFIGGDPCIEITYLSAGAGNPIKNIHFNHCLFIPYNNTKSILTVENDANLEINDVWFDCCVFRDANYAMDFGANAVADNWHFINSQYDSMVTAEWNLNANCTNFKAIQDGIIHRVVNAAGNMKYMDEIIEADTSGGPFNLTFPSLVISAMAGHRFVIKDTTGSFAANNLTILTQGAETIDGAANLVCNANYQSVELFSDGTNLYII